MSVYKSNTPTKDGRSWFFRVRKKSFDGNYKSYSSSRFMTKKEALENERIYLMKRDDPVKKNFDLVAVNYMDYLTTVKKKSTVYTYVKDYNHHIKPFFGGYSLDEINTHVVGLWHDEMNKKGLSTNYKNKIYAVAKNIFDYAIKEYGLTFNPIQAYGRFEEKKDKIVTDSAKLRYITYDEFKQFISVIDNLIYKTYFTFAYFTGCRRGEISALRFSDVDLINNTITINKTLYEEVKGTITTTSTKNNLNRKISISKILKDQLLEYKNEMQKYSDYSDNWYLFGCSSYIPKTTINRYKHKYFELSGVHEISMHEFRHSHVSLLINEYIKNSKERNMKIDTAKFFLIMSNRMGHTPEVMQKTYMHLFPSVQDEIVDLLDNL